MPSPPDFHSWTLGPLLGSGASGRVWTAHRPAGSEHRAGAIKIAAAPRSMTPAQVSTHWPRLSRRLGQIANLDHPGVIDIWEWGHREAEAQVWIAMERLRPVARGARVEAALAHALAHAHRGGVVHADIKPSNILRCGDGRCVLIDFALTPEGVAPGSPLWMAPECLTGAPASPAADVYALAQCMIEGSTGRPAFDPVGAGPAKLLSLVTLKSERPELDPGQTVRPRARQALCAATRRSPEDRPTARELATALEA